MSFVKSQPPLFHIGDWVKFDYGPKKVSARIVEDRGLLGVQGRRLYRVQLDEELGEASTFEVPENELETELPPVRLSYEIRYIRPDNTNVCACKYKKRACLKGGEGVGSRCIYHDASTKGKEQTTEDMPSYMFCLRSIHTSTRPHLRRLQASCVSSPTARGPSQTRCFCLDIRVHELNTRKTARTELS